MDRKRVGILIFPDVEVLDFCGPFEVFSSVRLSENASRRDTLSPFEVCLVAEHENTVKATGGLRVMPDYSFATCPPLDILVVPGGWGTRREATNEALLTWINDHTQQVETLTSVCTGSMLLGQIGVLDGRHATTHWQSLDRMRATFPTIHVEDNQHVVEDGNIFTSAGISAGIDMALRVVMRYHGEAVAHNTARYMEYPFPDSNARRINIHDTQAAS